MSLKQRIVPLQNLYKILRALMKLIPVVIEVLQDLADDGQVNNSVKK
jgi:hypothetical protein